MGTMPPLPRLHEELSHLHGGPAATCKLGWGLRFHKSAGKGISLLLPNRGSASGPEVSLRGNKKRFSTEIQVSVI